MSKITKNVIIKSTIVIYDYMYAQMLLNEWTHILKEISQKNKIEYNTKEIKFNICSDVILEWNVIVTVFMCCNTTCMCDKRR